ncbi:sigma-70 family RNA polymerase sigma factor [Streptomyces justiciae]|uniref:Sigma-70 family RNA polymerase sigma factor n=1 Tax=Streptomyces justiciae TaxID=2780140 RepID=A0ABU3M2B7_9ACTN|nr:sigma-70 family RNA polymerase sigma factor [Streptomyces justiciae]MDT7845654.1 sigma-70 family RNA polymerase sigma factor [Streptomyces justiciae]
MTSDHDDQVTALALDEAARSFHALRPRLCAIAFRVLGSRAEAEDVVQEAWVRWQCTDRSQVQAPHAFLATMTTRLAINVAQSARMRQETHAGLNEPSDTHLAPEAGAEQREELRTAVVVLLERLGPTERAAYVLRAAFDYPYEQIADLLQTTPANARQLFSRARRHLSGDRCTTADPAAHGRLFAAFVVAAQSGHMTALLRILAADIRGVRVRRVAGAEEPWPPSRRRRVARSAARHSRPVGRGVGGSHLTSSRNSVALPPGGRGLAPLS